MRTLIHYIPIATTLLAIPFAITLFQRYRERPGRTHLLWWGIGVAVYAVGTLTEALTTLLGWHDGIFRAWYISGALLGGAPLAQGTVYLLMKRKTATVLTMLLITVVSVAAVCVLLSPINHALVEPHRLTGKVLVWKWVRGFSPFINLYAVIFLIGGAIVSAVRFRKTGEQDRFIGMVLIAIGAILPGIGGTATRFGHTEVLYVTEFVGLTLIWLGYRYSTAPAAEPALKAEAITS
jgi:hypothetical protein